MSTVGKKFMIRVTAVDIAAGVMEDAESCPIALAAKRLRKSGCRGFRSRVRVGAEWMLLGGNFYGMPQAARDFIRQFDNGQTVKPFTFALDKK